MRVLFLYTELADYFIKCCASLAAHAEIHVVRWPVNKEAPFRFEFPEGLKIYDKKNYTRQQLHDLTREISPDVIVCSGWIDKDYLAVVKPYFGKIPTVLTCDTHWRGSLKQRLATLLSPFFLLDRFSHAWVPGKIQALYCSKLGFKKDNIKQGFYCCDLEKFNSVYAQRRPQKEDHFPKRFLYVGRYYDFKGVTDLWQGFIELQAERPNEWELWCLGIGDIEPVQHPKIKHFGFVQPQELDPIVSQCGVFVLPSRFEPWGVVVQEYAASGFPLLLSHEVGASGTFLKENVNGFSFHAGNKTQIKALLKKITELSDKELNLMSQMSHEAAQQITPQSWASTVLEIYNGFKQN